MKRFCLSFSSLQLFAIFCQRCRAVREVSGGCNYPGASDALIVLTAADSLSGPVFHCFYQNTFRWKNYHPWINIVPKVVLEGGTSERISYDEIEVSPELDQPKFDLLTRLPLTICTVVKCNLNRQNGLNFRLILLQNSKYLIQLQIISRDIIVFERYE